ncbi:MAG: TspO protein [Candidatus Pelagibacter sp. TMED64]|nr:TspO protein [Candidatus Pelagibacter sp.]OUU67356.1 MAG: TspO protein [Candidatus Pelagibacter sp. TMED64]|tara:strand:+ start:13514 stop:13978 length:465 start_codon:yes stop_codon:yes gene_type:complete
MIKKIPSLLIFCFLAFGASAWGGLVTSLYKEPWFSTLVKPTFNPPEWIFAPVWITLYLLMAFSIWLIWISPKRSEKIIYIYFIHLLVNGSWSLFFFALHQIFISLVIIALIIILVLWLIKLYYPINKLSSFLMIPYLIWLGFAFLLNFYIFILN